MLQCGRPQQTVFRCVNNLIFLCVQDVPKDSKTKHVPNANITLQIQWVPFDFTF